MIEYAYTKLVRRVGADLQKNKGEGKSTKSA